MPDMAPLQDGLRNPYFGTEDKGVNWTTEIHFTKRVGKPDCTVVIESPFSEFRYPGDSMTLLQDDGGSLRVLHWRKGESMPIAERRARVISGRY